MADSHFLAILKTLVKEKTLDNEQVNSVIQEYYPNLEFLEGSKSRVYFRSLVPWKLTSLKLHNLKPVLVALNKIYPKLYG